MLISGIHTFDPGTAGSHKAPPLVAVAIGAPRGAVAEFEFGSTRYPFTT